MADAAQLAAIAAADAQLLKDEYNLAIAKAKTALNPTFVIMAMLYPTIIAFSLQVRYNKFALLIPTPNVPGTPLWEIGFDGSLDQWQVKVPSMIGFTICCFLSIMLVHSYILIHLRIIGPPGAPRMVAALEWLPIIAFWASTSTYMLGYLSANGYGVDLFEYAFAAACCALLFVTTIAFLVKPLPSTVVLKTNV